MENYQVAQKPKKAKFWIFVGSTLIVALLVGAAYFAGRLFKSSLQPIGGEMVVTGDGNEVTKVTEGYSLEPAPDLPARSPDLVGMATKIENNSILVGLSNSQVVIIKDVDQANYDSIVEVVITRETELYRDVTSMPSTGSAKIQQKVVPMALDDLVADRPHAQVVAWGERKGDRLIADVVLCSMLPTFGN